MERHFAALGWDGLLLGSRRGLGWGLVWVLGLGLELRDWDIPVSSVRCTVKMAIKSARLFNKCWQHSEPQRNAPSFMISWRKWNMILWIARSDSWDSFFLFAPSLSPSRCSPVEWRSWSWRWSWSRRYLNPLLSCGCGNLLSPMLCIMSLRFVMLKLNACSTCPAFSTECHWQPTKTKYKKLNNNKRKNKNNDDKLMSLPQGSACCPVEALSAASA